MSIVENYVHSLCTTGRTDNLVRDLLKEVTSPFTNVESILEALSVLHQYSGQVKRWDGFVDIMAMNTKSDLSHLKKKPYVPWSEDTQTKVLAFLKAVAEGNPVSIAEIDRWISVENPEASPDGIVDPVLVIDTWALSKLGKPAAENMNEELSLE